MLIHKERYLQDLTDIQYNNEGIPSPLTYAVQILHKIRVFFLLQLTQNASEHHVI